MMKLSIFLGNKLINKHQVKTKTKITQEIKGVKDSMKVVLRFQLLLQNTNCSRMMLMLVGTHLAGKMKILVPCLG